MSIFIENFILVIFFAFVVTLQLSWSSQPIFISDILFNNDSLDFKSHRGDGRFDTALAMDVQYQPVLNVRNQIETILNKKLDFFKGWDANGEAHITVITPVEYYDFLRPVILIEEIEKIAITSNIQASDVKLLGIGLGQLNINGVVEETYFLIVDSEKLKILRKNIYNAFVSKGGNRNAWNYKEFYPHITIGYTKRDLHIQDGVIKDVEHSQDKRFELVLK